MALSTISGTTGITDATITSAKLADFTAAVDLNGVELILDADQDTTITADTDDRIDFKIAGVEHFSFSNSSGDTVIKPMVDAKDIVFQQYDGNKILEINDANYVAISGAAAGPGELRFYEDTDLGSHYTGFKAGNATASVSYVLPLADGTANYQLTTDGSGTLSWALSGLAHKVEGTNFTGSLLVGHATTGTLNAASENVGVGIDCLDAITTGDRNVAIGKGAMTDATSANYNVAVGREALGDVTVRSNNTAIGYAALRLCDNDYNIGLGYTAGDNITSGEGNVIIGSVDAGSATGDRQLLIAGNDGATTTTWIDGDSSGNVTMPAELAAATLDISGDADIDGTMEADAYTLGGASFIKVEGTNFTDSLLVGHSTTGTLDAASGNTGVGIDALDAITSGDNNVAIGYLAGSAITTGSINTIVGYNAGSTLTTATDNTAVGRQALKTSNGVGNVGIGRDAGEIIADGTYNICIGTNAGDNITSGSGNVVIGRSDVSSATGSDQLSISDGRNNGIVWMTGDSSANITFAATVSAATAFVPDAQDGAALGTTSLQFSDLFLADSAVLGFGDDNDTTLTHTDGTGLTLNSTNKLCFNDASQFIYGVSNAILGLGATDEIDLTATLVDINANVEISGTATTTGVHTFTAIPVLPANSIDSTHYADGSIDTAHMADSQITNAKLAATLQVGKQTIWIPANAMTPTESNGCAAIAAVETTSGRPDMYVLDFDKDSDEFAQFAIAFPKQWNLGTVTFQVFWSGIAATTDVDWGLQAVAMNDNETIDVAYGTAVVVTDNAQSAVEELLVSAESGAITIAGTPADNDLTYFRIYRDVSGDAMAGDARLHGVKVFFTTDAKNDA